VSHVTVEQLQKRIATLEASLEEIKKLKGIPGPRGPAGDIAAAVQNATRVNVHAVAVAESRVREAAHAKFEAMREEIRQFKQDLNERLQNAVDAHTVQLLRDYHLLNEKHEPTHWQQKWRGGGQREAICQTESQR
jgi:signal transduction protein with GAF and PtsI domain